MAETWPQSIITLLGAQDFGTLFHIGPRGADLLTGFQEQLKIRNILSLQPSPKKAETARQLSKDAAHVTIVEAAIGPTNEDRELYQFTLNEMDAFAEPKGLKSLFPGLRQTGSCRVPSKDLESLLALADLKTDAENILLLGANGEEMQLLQQLADLRVLQNFDHILLSLPKIPLYEAASDGPALIEKLRSESFDLIRQDSDEPDIPFAYLRISRERVALVKERDALLKELAESNRTHENAVEGHIETTKMMRLSRQEVDALKSERDALLQKLPEMEAALERAVAAQKSAKDETASKEQEISALRQKIETERFETKQLEKNILDLETELKNAQDTLEVTLLAQGRREMDLQELRTHFSKLSSEKAALEETLRSLALSLQTAFTHLEAAQEAGSENTSAEGVI